MTHDDDQFTLLEEVESLGIEVRTLNSQMTVVIKSQGLHADELTDLRNRVVSLELDREAQSRRLTILSHRVLTGMESMTAVLEGQRKFNASLTEALDKLANQ